MSQSIIFVDVDGPLLPRKMHMFHQNRKTGKENHPQFDEFGIRAFNLWAKYSQAKIVLSTAWSWAYSTDELKEIMLANGLGFDYHTEILTPKKQTSSRSNEIVWWLHDNAEHGDKFIAVDDDTSCQDIAELLESNIRPSPAKGAWIQVDYDNGMSWDNFLDGCEVLGIDLDEIYEKEFGIKKPTEKQKALRHTYLESLI